MRRRLTRPVGVLAALTLMVSACGGDDDDSSASSDETTAGTSTGSETPTTGGGGGECPAGSEDANIRVGVRTAPTGLDPYVSGSQGSQGGSERQALFSTIMKYDPESGEYEPLMAESLEHNDDATQWTLTLRDDVTFGNGEPVDTEAVRFTVNRHRAEDSTSLSKRTASQVESMEIVDAQTMVFNLSSPWGNFPSLLASPVGMVIHPETFEQLGPDEFAADPQGGAAGPFQLERWAQGEEMVVSARDDYWGGDVCVDTVTFAYGQEDTARYESFANGDLDVAFLRLPEVIAEAEADGVGMHTQVSNGGFVVQVNHGARGIERPGEDLRVRQAIAHAIDPEIVNQRGFGGEGMPSTALVPDTSLLYTDGQAGLEYDPELASQLLEEAKAEGYDGSIHFLCNNTYEEAAIPIAGMLEAVGFTVEQDFAMSIGEYANRVLETDYDINCGSVLGSDSQPWATMSQLYSGAASDGSLTGYESDAMVEALTDVKAALSVDERREAWVDVQEVWNDEAVGAVYSHAAEVWIWRDGVEGLDFSNELRLILSGSRVTG